MRDSLVLSTQNIYPGNMTDAPMTTQKTSQKTTATHRDPKRAYHHGNLKAALIEAGVAILEEEGMPALSLRTIASRAGVSHTAPKNHFGSLRGLLTAIATEGWRRHAAFMRDGISEVSGRAERLRAAMEGYVRFAREHEALFSLMFSTQHCEFTDPGLRAAAADSYAILAGIATDLDWDKTDAPGGQRRTEMMLWSLAHGYAQLANAGFFGQGSTAVPPAATPFLITDIMPGFGYRSS